MTLPTATLNTINTYNCEEGICAYNLYFRMTPYDPEVNAGIIRDGEPVETGDLECNGEGECHIDTTSPRGVQTTVQIVLYTGAGPTRKESLSNTLLFTPQIEPPLIQHILIILRRHFRRITSLRTR